VGAGLTWAQSESRDGFGGRCRVAPARGAGTIGGGCGWGRTRILIGRRERYCRLVSWALGVRFGGADARAGG